jgi:flagellar hook protein FlgE
MIGGLWNGVSGLNAFEKALNVESNNSTNVNTVGYKSDDIKFADMMYQNGYGKGTSVESVSKVMTQGGLKPTNSTYDVAIEGKGYFIVSERGTNDTYYTRAGNFYMAEDGLLQSQNGMKVLGLTPQSNNVITSDPTKTKFDDSYTENIATKTIGNSNFLQTINARATNYTSSAVDKGVSGDGLKTKSAQIIDIDALIADYKNKIDLYSTTSTAVSSASTSQVTNIDLSTSMNELKNENDSIKVTIDNTEVRQSFDTDIATTMKKLSDKISNMQGLSSSVDTMTGLLTINSLIPAKEVRITDAQINENFLAITNTQNATLGTGVGVVNSSRDALKSALEFSNAKLLDITSTISLAGQESLAVNEIQLKLTNLNLSENSFGQVEISDGIVFLKDNDNKFIIGKLQTADFTNEQGLSPQGDNVYKNTSESGRAFYAGNLNKLVGNSLEQSTSNLGNSLTSLLVYQKAFEANSKSITTSDDMLQTAIQLIK